MKPVGGDYWQITCVGDGSNFVMADLAYGDSVAVDGVCLTVKKNLTMDLLPLLPQKPWDVPP
ncbi:hypothetical protein RintRC_3420 [Richelia intracellularis]|nr:hypothetical protein RintRC_3420 [Richelia intracellularis]